MPQPPGSYEICHVCFWEDDLAQLLDPWFAGGANRPSLVQAQANYCAHGAMESRFLANVKGVLPGDAKDPNWRCAVVLDRGHVRLPSQFSAGELSDPIGMYYWRRAVV